MENLRDWPGIIQAIPGIIHIADTGGPCGGKTTFVERARVFIGEQDGYPLVVSEAAREILGSGIWPDIRSRKSVIDFQRAVFALTLKKEMEIFKLANDVQSKGKQVVILCDRGLIDGRAYLTKDEFQTILDEFGITYTDALLRYTAVLNFVTAARGAEKFYMTDLERTETLERARMIQNHIDVAWKDHPKKFNLDNSTDFEGKMKWGLRAISGLMIPQGTRSTK